TGPGVDIDLVTECLGSSEDRTARTDLTPGRHVQSAAQNTREDVQPRITACPTPTDRDPTVPSRRFQAVPGRVGHALTHRANKIGACGGQIDTVDTTTGTWFEERRTLPGR